MVKAAVDKALAKRATDTLANETIKEKDNISQVYVPELEEADDLKIVEPKNADVQECKKIENLEIVELKEMVDDVIPENEESISGETEETVDFAVAEHPIKLDMQNTPVVVPDTEDSNIEEIAVDTSPKNEDSRNTELPTSNDKLIDEDSANEV